MRRFLMATVGATVLSITSTPVHANTVTNTAGTLETLSSESAESAEQLGETVLVTARKRQERVQDVPLSIGVISASDIIGKRVVDIERVANLIPGLTFDVGLIPTDTRVSIRGLQAVRGRPNVAILVDGVDTSSENFGVAGGGILANLRLVDVERIEVVKGPQNILYGRSAFAGAINYITKRPSDNFEALLSAEIGSFDTRELKGSISGPMADHWSARFNINIASKGGDYTNPVTGGKLNVGNSAGAALGVLYKPTDNLNAYLRLQYSDEAYSERATVSLLSADPRTGATRTQDGAILLSDRRPNAPASNNIYSITGDLSKSDTYRNRKIDISGDPNQGGRPYKGSEIKTFRASLAVNWKTDFGEWDFLTGYTDNKSTFNEDFDQTNYTLSPDTGVATYSAGGANSTLALFQGAFGWPLSYLPAYGLSSELDVNVGIDQFSQEVRWSKEFGRVRATLDALYWEESATYDDASLFWLREGGNTALGAFLSFAQGGTGFHLATPGTTSLTPQFLTRDTTSVSLAGQLAIKVTPKLSVDIEARTIRDEIVYTGLNFDAFSVNTYGTSAGGLTRTDPPIKTDKLTPRVNVGYNVSADTLVYGSYALGYKPGGIDTTDQNGNVNDGRFKPEKVTTWELGLKYVSPGRRFSTNVAYFDNVYADQQIAIVQLVNGLSTSQTVNIGESTGKGFEFETNWNALQGLYLRVAYTHTESKYTDYILPRCGAVDSAETNTPNCNFNGKFVPFTPEHKASFGARYERNLAGGGIAAIEVDTRYESLRYLTTANLGWFPEYWQTDVRLAYEGDAWTADFFVTNVFDDDSPRTGSSNVDYGFFDLNTFQVPRSFLIALPPKQALGFRLARAF